MADPALICPADCGESGSDESTKIGRHGLQGGDRCLTMKRVCQTTKSDQSSYKHSRNAEMLDRP